MASDYKSLSYSGIAALSFGEWAELLFEARPPCLPAANPGHLASARLPLASARAGRASARLSCGSGLPEVPRASARIGCRGGRPGSACPA